MTTEFEWDEAKWKKFVKRIQEQLSPSKIDKIIEAVAWNGQKYIVANQVWKPKKGISRSGIQDSWKVKKENDAHVIYSTSKIALFLEEGTKAHGPRFKKFLYIPLRPGAATWRQGFVIGKDYILVKRVKGIKSRKYFKPVSEEILKMMVNDFETHLEKI